MLIGVPREIKPQERRVGLTPAAVGELAARGHELLIEREAGVGAGASDAAYRAAGAEIAGTAEEVFRRAEMIVKVKEPQPAECAMLRDGQVLFGYLHLAADRAQAEALARSKSVCIAYETVTDAKGRLPLLVPMSEVAGRMSVQAAAHCLESHAGGAGLLLGGVPGVRPARVAILGGGVAGAEAARIAIGMGAAVTVLDKSVARLAELDAQLGGRLRTLYSTGDAIAATVRDSDVAIGAVLVPGASAPKLVGRATVAGMRPGSVVVDIAIDQGGCFETSRPTSHAEPTYVEEGVVHYCVTNMPGAVARTSTEALTNATLPFVLRLADLGWQAAAREDVHLRSGLNVCRGRITHPAVAAALAVDFTPPEALLAV